MAVRVHVAPQRDPQVDQAVIAAGGELVELADAEALLITEWMPADAIRASLHPGIRWVSLPLAGIDSYLPQGLFDDDRIWTSTKGTYADTCSEHAVALLLACTRGLPAAIRRRSWYRGDLGWRLRGATVTVLGTGGIGSAVATKLASFGARLLGVNRTGAAVAGFDQTYRLEDRLTPLAESRAAVVALASTPLTAKVIGRAELDALGADGVLVNVARGELLDQDELVQALQDGRLAAAGLDVTTPEPLPDGHPLWDLPNVVVTSHTANPSLRVPWAANVVEYLDHVAHNVAAFAAGAPLEGTIDLSLGY